MNKKALFIILSTVLIAVAISYVFTQSEKIDVYEVTRYNITYIVEINNFGPAIATDIPLRVALIKNWPPYQELESITIQPEPEDVITDAFDNRFALFVVPSLNPNTAYNVTINTIFYSNSSDFNILKTEIGEFDAGLDKFTLPSKFVESNDDSILEMRRNLTTYSDYIVDYAWNAYTFIINDIEYEQQPGELGAAWTLENKEGGSAELSNLYVALLRANNIPARRLSGWGNHLVEGEVLRSTQFAHGWVEFYLPEYGWIPADPSWGKTHKFDNFAKSDDDHIVLTKGAGIHFFTRGAYNSPYGEARLDTKYIVRVNEKDASNVSPKRLLIVFIVFISPLLFALFIYLKIKNFRILLPIIAHF